MGVEDTRMMEIRKSGFLWTINFVLIVLLFCPFVSGNVIYVNNDADGANDGSNWIDAYTCLQDALTAVKGGDEIRVAQGTYKPDQQVVTTSRSGPRLVSSGDRMDTFQLVNGVVIKGGYAGFDEPDPDARDIGVYKTILSGDLNGNDSLDLVNSTENSYHVVTGNGTDETAVLDGFTITGGNANGTDWESQGGGMFNKSGSPTVTNCTFENNSSTRSGGGMSNFNSSPMLTNCVFSRNLTNNNGGGILCHGASSPTITNCIISENTADFWGGGIECDDSSPTIIDCTISGNAASVAPDSATGGGGIYCRDSHPTIINCTISGNTSTSGGGIGCNGSSPTIINCTISSNTSTRSAGGIGCYWNSSPTITDCIITDNTSEQAGGGIYCYRDSFAIITNNIITGNSAGQGNGGGIMCWDNSSPSITNNIIMGNSARFGGGINCNRNCSPSIINNIIIGNSADDQGGGIYCGDSSPDIINNTIIRNWATWGGGIYSGGDDSFPTVINTILWMDSPQEIYLHAGGSVAVTYCCVRGGWTGAGNINADPLFVDAAEADYHLQVGSPCVDTGNNSAIGPSLVVDLEQNPRIENGIVDMGAYEFGITLAPPTLSEALDTDLSFTTSGDADWLGQTTTSYYGKDAAQSGDISHNQESWMQTTVNGAGTVSFYWKISSEVGYDFLEFYIDGSLQEEVSGLMDDWKQEMYTIGTLDWHTLEWRYVKDKGTDSGSDCGWVDKLEWVPTPAPAELPLAFNPEPADGVILVDTNVTLSWSSGSGAQLHIVYFSDNFDDVNIDAGGILLEITTYTPGPLELDKVYYWRVDEFDGVVIHKGEVWSFATEGALE
jgi:hypothetical protein